MHPMRLRRAQNAVLLSSANLIPAKYSKNTKKYKPNYSVGHDFSGDYFLGFLGKLFFGKSAVRIFAGRSHPNKYVLDSFSHRIY